MNIAIIGAGEIGQGILNSLDPKNKILISDRNLDKIPNLVTAEEAVKDADLVFYCVPSSGVRPAIVSTAPLLKETSFVVSLTKGIEAQSGLFIYDLFDTFVDPMRFALLSGPMLAEELGSGKGAAGTVASRNSQIFDLLKTVFKPNYIKLDYSNDVKSVALSGVLKNVYSLLFGISDGLGFGNNIKGLLVSKFLLESEAISKKLKMSEKIFLGESGFADFIATAFSPLSLNRQAGMEIAKGNKAWAKSSEGENSLPVLLKMLGDSSDLPALSAIKDIFLENKEPLPILRKLIYG